MDKGAFIFFSPNPYGVQEAKGKPSLLSNNRPVVALQEGVIYTDRNATDNTQQRGEGLSGLNVVDFSAVKARWPYGRQERFKKKASRDSGS